MRCKHCKAEINVLDTRCPACGTSQSILGESRALPKQESHSLLDRVTAEIDAELKQAEHELFTENGPGGTPHRGPGETGRSWRLGMLDAPPGLNLAEADAVALETTAEDIQQIAQFVFYSLHVQRNPLYKARAEKTTLKYLADEDLVNAFASDRPIRGIDTTPPLIVLFGGLARATRVAGTALGIDRILETAERHKRLVRTIRHIGGSIVKNHGTFSAADAAKVFKAPEPGGTARKARSYAAAMNMAVIAHELGHLALGHTLGQQVSLEILRNQEREADSFAASVASAGPFSDYIVAGGIFWWVILAWADAAAGHPTESTHPHAGDRLMDYIRANRAQAAELGIDDQTILEFLP